MEDIKIYKLNNISVIKMKGDIEYDDIDTIERTFDTLIRDGEFNVLVNCSEISFISSSDISLFLRMFHRLNAEKGELKMCSQNAFIQKILRITNLSCIFPYYKSEDDAVKAFKAYRR